MRRYVKPDELVLGVPAKWWIFPIIGQDDLDCPGEVTVSLNFGDGCIVTLVVKNDDRELLQAEYNLAGYHDNARLCQARAAVIQEAALK